MPSLGGTEGLREHGQDRPHVVHRVVAHDLLQTRLGPVRALDARRGGGVEVRAVFAGREAEPLLGLEVPVVLEVVALETGLAVGGLLGADEAEPRIAEAHAIVGMPGPQHGARDLARHAADGRPLVDPARRHVAHPGLPVRLVHVLDAHAAQVIRQVVVLRARDGVGQPVEPELGEAGQELLEVLAAEGAKDQLGRVGAASPAHRGEDEPGQIRRDRAAMTRAAPRSPRSCAGGHPYRARRRRRAAPHWEAEIRVSGAIDRGDEGRDRQPDQGPRPRRRAESRRSRSHLIRVRAARPPGDDGPSRTGAAKSIVLQWLAAHHGIDVSEIVAVGDWMHDIRMFAGGRPLFAMADGTDDVKAAASDHLTRRREDRGRHRAGRRARRPAVGRGRCRTARE